MTKLLSGGFLVTSIFLTLFGQSLFGQQPVSPLVDSFQKHRELKRKSPFGLQWQSVGPLVNSARVEAVQSSPQCPGTIYAAFGSGGLWKTTNNGVTWRSIFEEQATYGIGDIAVAPSDPNIIYVGTGESLKKARNFTIPGTGIYRSVDAGNSWVHLGLNDSWHIGEIAVHPKDPDTVLVAVLGHFWSTNKNRGLYLTNDGGKNWSPVLHINDKVGANDVVWSPSNPKLAYASVWENHPGVAGKSSSIYRSTDAGKTWNRCSNGLPNSEQVGRIGLAVSHTNSQKVYALIDNREFAESAAAEVYLSTDGGENWKRTHSENQKFLSRIGWYFADIYVNPKNDEDVFALGVRLAHSTDGGKTFNFIGGKVSHATPSAASGMHLDHCELWINPENPDHLILGNDGGLYQSFDNGKHWRHFNNIPTGEFYDIEIEASNPYRIFAGAQDNATVFGFPDELDATTRRNWKYLWIDPWNGGDGCITLSDPHDPNTVYFSAQEGAFRRKNLKTDQSISIRPGKGRIDNSPDKLKLSFNFVAPMVISPHDSTQLYLGGNYLLRSSNRGDRWQVISPDLGKTIDPDKISKAAAAVAESPTKPGLLYVGTDKGAVWVSIDGGKQWADRSKGLPVAYVRSLVPSRHSESRVYLAASAINYDDLDTYIYVSEDCGKTWKPIGESLPHEPANVIAEHPNNESILFAGTFRGTYISLDRGQSWSTLGVNMPVCSIADLAIHEKSLDLIAGTHGRGIYRLNLRPLNQVVNQKLLDKKVDALLDVPDARLPARKDTRPGTNFRGVDKMSISFWLARSGKVKLTFIEAAKKTSAEKENTEVANFEWNCKQGLNEFRWDLGNNRIDSPNPYHVQYRNYLRPGNYKVILKTAQGSLERSFKVVVDKPQSIK